MTRNGLAARRPIADATLTLRLTQQDRDLLQQLVDLKAEELADSGAEVTAAGYVRGLIRHEARAKGLLERPGAPTSPVPDEPAASEQEA